MIYLESQVCVTRLEAGELTRVSSICVMLWYVVMLQEAPLCFAFALTTENDAFNLHVRRDFFFYLVPFANGLLSFHFIAP